MILCVSVFYFSLMYAVNIACRRGKSMIRRRRKCENLLRKLSRAMKRDLRMNEMRLTAYEARPSPRFPLRASAWTGKKDDFLVRRLDFSDTVCYITALFSIKMDA